MCIYILICMYRYPICICIQVLSRIEYDFRALLSQPQDVFASCLG